MSEYCICVYAWLVLYFIIGNMFQKTSNYTVSVYVRCLWRKSLRSPFFDLFWTGFSISVTHAEKYAEQGPFPLSDDLGFLLHSVSCVKCDEQKGPVHTWCDRTVLYAHAYFVIYTCTWNETFMYMYFQNQSERIHMYGANNVQVYVHVHLNTPSTCA